MPSMFTLDVHGHPLHQLHFDDSGQHLGSTHVNQRSPNRRARRFAAAVNDRASKAEMVPTFEWKQS